MPDAEHESALDTERESVSGQDVKPASGQPGQAVPPGPGKKAGITVDALFGFLKEEGFLPQKSVSEEDVIEFKYQGFHVSMELTDGEYIRLIFAYDIDQSDINFFDVMAAAQSVMFELRMVKVVCGAKWIQFSIEVLVSSLKEYSRFFIRYLDILSSAVIKHRDLYLKYKEEYSRRQNEKSGQVDEMDELMKEMAEYQSRKTLKN